MDKKVIIFLSFVSILVLIRIVAFYYFRPEVKEDQNISFVSRLSTQPKLYNNYQTFVVSLPTGESVFVKTSAEKDFNYADRVKLSGNLNYRLLNEKTRILTIDFPEISLDNVHENTFLAVVNFIRQQISDTFYAYLPKDLAGLMLGIVIGVKADFSPQFYKSLKLSGVMHVIAASGMNVTMVSGFFFFTFSLFLKRQSAIIISCLIIVFYAFLAGFQPSIIRASIMGIILFVSQVWGRQNYSFYALIITLFSMLIIWPQYLIDVGFQLSFAATLGLLFISNIFGRLKDFASEDLTTTLSAQIATLPILLTTFGTYSVWSVVVNFLVLWTIPPLMVLGGLAAIVSLIFAPIAKYLLLLCLPLLTFFEAVVEYFANPSASLSVDYFPLSLSIGYYILLISILIFAKRKRAN